jgi:polyisoprenoid-binding protein YceI
MTFRHHAAIALALAGIAACGVVQAQPGPGPALPVLLQSLPAGRYTVDPAQTVARFRVRYLG